MNRRILRCFYFLPVFLMLSIGLASAKTVEVNNTISLVASLSQLADGDTLKLASGVYTITPALAPDGLILTSSDWSPYKDLTITGAGIDATILDFSNSYGFFAYFSEHLLIKGMTIKNGKKNGGVYVQSGNVNLEQVRFESCSSVTFGSKQEANGGAIFYDENSSFSYIRECVFVNNFAQYNGGAIAYMNSQRLYPQKSTIENCQFYNNSSLIGASAIYLKYIYSYIYLERNALFSNSNTPAIYANAVNSKYARLFLKNNSIALNDAGGLSIGSSLRSYLFINNSAIVDNNGFDVKAAHSSTKLTGDYNLIRTAPENRFVGYFNEMLNSSARLFKVENDSLKHTLCAANFLAGRIPEGAKSDYDLYGDTCLTPADIGAINIEQGDNVAIWTGASGQDFFAASNWRNGLLPIGAKKIIITNCSLNSYPIVADSISLLNGGDLSYADLYITPAGILENNGHISLDTIYLESQNGGSAQLLNNGTIEENIRMAEFYFSANKWVPFYMPEAGRTANSVLPGLSYDADYEVMMQNEEDADIDVLAGLDQLDQNQGYWMKSAIEKKAVFEVFDNNDFDFNIQHTSQIDSLSSGWNLVANPYSASVNTIALMENAGNNIEASGAIYTYDGFRYKVYVDGVGDEEATIIAPYEAFYVKALDNDKTASVESGTFSLKKNNLLVVENELLKSSIVDREGVLSVGISSSNNVVYDWTYLRFESEASTDFDYAFDAMKLDRLDGVNSSLIYSDNNDNVNYAVNTLALEENEELTIPLRLDFVPSTISRSLKRKLHFTVSGGDSVSYLLHDALKDSSESIEIKNKTSVTFYTGTDAFALVNRYSIQVFDGEVPSGVVGVNERSAVNVVETVTSLPDTLFVYDTITYKLQEDSIWGNSDTVIALEYMVDSFFVDSIFVKATYTDSIFYDTTFVDTTWLWGTHEYLTTDTLTNSLFKRYTSYADTLKILGIYYENYIVYDTLLVSSLNDVAEGLENIKVYGGERSIYIESNRRAEVAIYDLNGIKVRQLSVSEGNSKIDFDAVGIFIVQVNVGEKKYSKKIIINN